MISSFLLQDIPRHDARLFEVREAFKRTLLLGFRASVKCIHRNNNKKQHTPCVACYGPRNRRRTTNSCPGCQVVKEIYLSGREEPVLRSAQPGAVTEYNAPTRDNKDALGPPLYQCWVLNESQRRLPQQSPNIFDYLCEFTLLNYSAFSSCVPASCCWPYQPVPHHLLSYMIGIGLAVNGFCIWLTVEASGTLDLFERS